MKKIDHIYIYEISGDLEPIEESPCESYLGCWNEAGHSYLFFSEESGNIVHNILRENPMFSLISVTDMDYDQWEPADALKPFVAGSLSIVPAWMAENDDRDSIILDPGVVFGAGTHHTTNTCLEIMADLMIRENISTVIDIGTGSGILAIAAARLGARQVTAVDNNNLAVKTAERNIRLNRCEENVKSLHGEAKYYISADADLVLANLVLWVLSSIFKIEVDYNASYYIVSGLNGTEVQDFIRQIEDLPFEVVRHEMDNLWSTLLLKNVSINSHQDP